MSLNTESFTSERVKGNVSKISIYKTGTNNQYFIREINSSGKESVIWLDETSAIKLAVWILENNKWVK